MPKVVLDTNTIISAYVFGGKPEEVFLLGISGEITLVTSPAIMREIADVLTRKMLWDETKVEQVIKQIARVSEIVRSKHTLSIIDDEPDNRVLEAAVAGKADYIVSGDKHLLDLDQFEGIKIRKAAQLLDSLGANQ